MKKTISQKIIHPITSVGRFSDSYYKTEATFVDFIRDEQFAVKGDYKETWEFIKLNGNSLKRYSNFHLFFEYKKID